MAHCTARSRLRRRVLRWILASASALPLGAAVLPATALAEGSAALTLENRVKAAFLYKFLGYVEFPATAFPEPTSPVTIGVLGADDIAAELSRIVAGRSIGNRPIVVRTLHENEADVPLHLLFVGSADCARAARILKASPPAALLGVTDCDNAPPPGSAINFRIIDERVRFDVALEAAEKNNVKLSSRLLTVANRVQKGAIQ
jgi:hypothetical protein